MNYASPWCPACSNRKGDAFVCEACYARLPDQMKDALIRAKEALWTLESECITYLGTPREDPT